jgi:acetaldehyde dehydrogenase / alcohol dehydrogenase
MAARASSESLLGMAIAIEDPAAAGGEWSARLDGYVERARMAANALRTLDQPSVDRIVWAMTVAGLEHAVDLAELAMEETQFGVLEDKVLKNYIATEFLYDYLKDKKSVGVIDEDRERAIQYIAEPIGVVLALLPITNPTSTALFKSIVAAKTRDALIMRPSARAARCATRAAELLQEAGEAAGLPPHALQVIPDPTLDVSQYLFHHPGIDFIWTTGGPKAVVNILISKTFDSSVICPAEQTCVIDDAIYESTIEEFQRMGARMLTDEQTAALAAKSFADDGRVEMQALGQSCINLGALAGFDAFETDKVLLAPLPSELDALAVHPFIAEKLMPVLGIVRSPSVEHAVRACELVTEHGGLGHTSAVYATDEDVIDRFALAIRTGRILVNAPTAVGALGGV